MIDVQINASEFDRTLKRFVKRTGTGIEDGVKMIAETSARALATKIRPYGLAAKIGRQFQESIAEEIRHVRYGVNVGAYQGSSIEAAHESLRRRGNVRMRRVGGNYWQPKISEGDAQAYTRRKQRNAGMAKAGWFSAAVDATGRKMKRKPARWVARHMGSKTGRGYLRRRGAKTQVELHNTVPYLDEAQDPREIQLGLEAGRRGALKHMRKTIDKATQSATR